MDVREYNVGDSDYSKHKFQVWDLWIEYKLNSFDGDILKRLLRTKKSNSRLMDLQKIKHICLERIRQIKEGEWWVYPEIKPVHSIIDIAKEYDLNILESEAVHTLLEPSDNRIEDYNNIIYKVDELGDFEIEKIR